MLIRSMFLGLLFSIAAFSQPQIPLDSYEKVPFGGGVKTSGSCLVWDSSGRAITGTCSAGSGEVNTASSLGSGVAVYSIKSGVDLRFKGITLGSNKLSLATNSTDITFDVVPGNLLMNTFGGFLTISQIGATGTPSSSTCLYGDQVWRNCGSGGGGPANTDALTEGTNNLYFTNSRARAAISGSGVTTYSSSTGVIACATCVATGSSYADPAWLTSLAWAKLAGVPTYQLSSEKSAANGYASLGAGGLVPPAQLGTGSATGSTVLKGDGTWGSAAGTVNFETSGTFVAQQATLNFVAGTGVSRTVVSGGGKVTETSSVDTATVATRDQTTTGTDNYCASTTGTTTVTCSPVGNALAAYTSGMPWRVLFTGTLGATPTLNVSGLGAKRMYAADGTSDPTGTAGVQYTLIYDAALNAAAGGFRFPGGGSTAATAISGMFMPMPGQMDTGVASPIFSAGLKVFFWQFNVPFPGISFAAYRAFVTAAAQGNIALAVYDSTCTLVAGSTGQATGPGGNTVIRAAPASRVNLAAGTYFMAYTSTVATSAIYGLRGSYFSDIANGGDGSNPADSSAFIGANDATGSTPIVMPANCTGTRASPGMSSSSVPFIILK